MDKGGENKHWLIIWRNVYVHHMKTKNTNRIDDYMKLISLNSKHLFTLCTNYWRWITSKEILQINFAVLSKHQHFV